MDSISKLMSEQADDAKSQKKNAGQKAHDDEIQNAILVLAAEVIRCNRNYTAETEKLLFDFLAKQFGQTGIKRKVSAVQEHLEIGTEPLTKISCRELKLLTTHQSRLAIIDFLWMVAAVDDFVNAKEIRCIHRIAGYLGIADKEFKEVRHRLMSEHNPFRVLGIEEGATPAQVRSAYRKMVLKYHPDKRDAGVTEAEAGRKFREIQRAFETIKNQAAK